MRYNCTRLLTESGRVFILFGELNTRSRVFGYTVFTDGSVGSPVLCISGDFASGFVSYFLNDEECEPDEEVVLGQCPARAVLTEELITLPAALAKFGAVKFGKESKTLVRLYKPVWGWEDTDD